MSTASRDTADFLERALRSGEVSIGFTRLAVIALMTVEEGWFLGRHRELAHSVLGWFPLGVMAIGAGLTAAGLRGFGRGAPGSRRLSVALDALLVLGVSLPPALGALPGYQGASSHATFPFFLVAIAASALRLSRPVVRMSIACNSAAAALLLGVDRVAGTAPAPGGEVLITWVVAFLAASFVADAAAVRGRRYVRDGADAALAAARARQALGLYVSEEVADAAVKDGTLAPAGRRQAVGVVVARLVDFDAHAAAISPERLVQELNAYFLAMGQAVETGRGVIDRLGAEELVVVFGVPGPTADAASRALRTAGQMARALEAHNLERGRLALPPLRHALGVHFGEAVVGTLGTPGRLQYTVVGEVVVIARRLAEAAAAHGATGIASAALADVSGRVEGVPRLRSLGSISLAGRTQPVLAHALEIG